MHLLRGALAAATLCVMSSFAEARVAAVLMVEDEQGGQRQALTEQLGAQLYGRFLGAGPYARVTTLVGRERSNQRLAAAIRQLARDHDAVDLFLSVHTTRRRVDELLELIPPPARKLRLVYSTACHGAHNEREAWEAVGARAIVTHDGINNPLLAFPYFLSRWLVGAPAGPAVVNGYRQTQRLMALALSLPGLGNAGLPDVAGSRPVYSGDRDLRITSAVRAPALRRYPPELRYSARKGGGVGLALRALAHRGFYVSGANVSALLDEVVLPAALPQEVLDQVDGVRILSPALGKARLELKREVELEQDGVTLEFARQVTLWAGELDVTSKRLVVNIQGLWVSRGLLKARINRLIVHPADDPRDGYQATAKIDVFGFVPWTHSIELGGSRARPIADDGPIWRDLPQPARGLVQAIAPRG